MRQTGFRGLSAVRKWTRLWLGVRPGESFHCIVSWYLYNTSGWNYYTVVHFIHCYFTEIEDMAREQSNDRKAWLVTGN